jgi:NAD(P)-dependent dehydrogenase (short-subunit alcohol dehydrogenase family)
MDDLFDLRGRVVILTGGLGQLGRQFTDVLLRRGARVAVFDRRAAGRGRTHERLMTVPVDVTSRADIARGLQRVIRRWGVPHALINNAAIDVPPGAGARDSGPFETYPEAAWDRLLAVNLKGAFLCCQVVGTRMAKAGRGTIINLGSLYGVVAPDQRIYPPIGKRRFVKPAAYAASKSALLNLTRYLATYWAPRNVRVNALTLGGVENGQPAAFRRRYNARVPMGRMARPHEGNGALVFLLSDAASYVTGTNLVVDGGWMAW